MQASQFVMLAAVMVAFYLLLVRPQQQQAKRQREMVQSLAPGTEIVTIGGIFATVVTPGDERIRVELADGSLLDIAPRAVSEVLESAHHDSAEDEVDAESVSDDLDAPSVALEDPQR